MAVRVWALWLALQAAVLAQGLEVSIVGEVRRQGVYQLEQGATASELLQAAGGATDRGDVNDVILLRGDQKIRVDLSKPPILRMGDVLILNPGKRIYVTGEVRKVGAYSVSYRSTRALLDAIEAAGGLKVTAAIHRICLVRPTLRKPILIDLEGVPLPSEQILDGDTVAVQPMRCAVMGRVARPGQVIVRGSESLDYVLKEAALIPQYSGPVFVVRAADVERGMDRRETYSRPFVDVPIHDGDVVFVPDQGLDGKVTPPPSILFIRDPEYPHDRVYFAPSQTPKKEN